MAVSGERNGQVSERVQGTEMIEFGGRCPRGGAWRR